MVGYCWPDATAPSANPDTERRTIIYVVCNLLWAVGGDFTEPVDQLGIAATLLDQTIKTITTRARALLTVDVQHVELADQITEYDRAVTGH